MVVHIPSARKSLHMAQPKRSPMRRCEFYFLMPKELASRIHFHFNGLALKPLLITVPLQRKKT